MSFNSWDFVLFFLVVFSVSAFLPRYSTAHKWWLLLASWFFYASWSWHYLGLILFTTTLDWSLGPRFSRSAKPARLIAISVVANLGILALFKYGNFAVETANYGLQAFDAAFQFSALDLLLPVGISFYTFQSLSYTIDVYRGELAPRKSFLDYALFVSFFPQLVAGPIVRASEFFRELDTPRKADHQEAAYALTLIGLGFVKKVVFADGLAQAIDPTWNNLQAAQGWEVLLATYGFAFQIYFDFSGYTDIAIGIALLFGFRFPTNFNYPYLATSLQDFWRRWHMTLSRWLRDYLYISLGGNRIGELSTYINLSVTMLLGGLWHGASWNFIIWGGIHGLWLVFERKFLLKNRFWNSKANGFIRWFVTMHVVCFAWIFFRTPDFASARLALTRLFSVDGLQLEFIWSTGLSVALIGFLAAHLLGGKFNLKKRVGYGPLWLHVTATSLALLALIWFAPNRTTPFIYFQF